MAIIAVGHRGTNIGVPENSIMSHEKAYSMGARGIEFDIQICADGEFVIFHDSTLNNKSTGKGEVKHKTLEQLKELRLLYKGQTTDHQIPTLKEGLENVRGRFMVDLDFKNGPDNSAAILRQLLKNTGFDLDGAPLVTIFCRDNDAYEKLESLNDLYAVRPLYLNKKQAKQISTKGVQVMGLRNYKFTFKRARRIRNLNMHLFSNAMKLNLLNLLREFFKRPIKLKKPSLKKLRKIYKRAMDGDSLFIQTDYLPELVTFLQENDAYQDRVLDRNFQPLPPVPIVTVG